MKRSLKRPLGEVAEFINGRAFKPSDWSATGLPIIRIQNLTDAEASANLYDGNIDERNLVRNGDLLVSWSATLDVFEWDRGNAVLNQHIFLVRPDYSIIRKRFLFYALKAVMDQLRGQTHGATMKHITKGLFSNTEILVPSLEEQEQIENSVESADTLRTLRARADARTAALVPALFEEMFGDVVGMKTKWKWLPFRDLVTIEAKLVDPREEKYQELPHIGADRIESKTGNILPAKTAQEDGLISSKFLFDERDVLYSKIRPNLRKAGLPEREGLCSADVYPLRPGPMFVREFLWTYLLTDHFTNRALEYSARANMPKLNREQLESITAPVPPIDLQRKFASRVASIRAMQSAQAASRGRVEGLFQAMVAEVFG